MHLIFNVMANLLIISGHDNSNISVANKTIINDLKSAFPDAEFSQLDEYGFNIDVKAEQEKLVKADVIVFQFPVYWSSCPAILQNWFEKVLSHGFAYGSQGNALKGKKAIFSCTAGAVVEDYTTSGYEGSTLEDSLGLSLQALCNVSKMKYCGLIKTHGVMNFYDGDKTRAEQSTQISKETSAKLIEKIKELL